ncbi:hypothetical protein FHS39_003539 [Streptomyces olivoverticillatus]|uniref:Lipoprotein n=1 Tax=Streptomyces olivoverticillatus TaxID=66427 RepID=A0A7W7LRL0_9ACTN|nr:hypothetical protein [Streptomyces olivoverticillatus]MBB4894481.1 hypothetical protein [Streptomyces olivoverticillatus]
MREAARWTGAAVITAVLVTGCGTSGGGGKGAGETSAAQQPSASPTASAHPSRPGIVAPGVPGASANPSQQKPDGKKFDGIWVSTTSDGVSMHIVGTSAVYSDPESTCMGEARQSESAATLDLKCNGKQSAISGTAALLPGGKAIKVAWQNGRINTLQNPGAIKVELPKLDDFPTSPAGRPSE